MSVFCRNNKWYIDYYVEGLRIRECVGKSKTEAQKALAVRKSEIVQGKYNFKSKKISPRFEEFAKEYMDYSKANKKSFTRDITSIKNLQPFLSDKRLSDISPFDVEKYKAKRKNEVKPATVNRELTCLKHMFSMAIKWGKTEANPVKEVKMFKEDNKKDRILSHDEADRLIAECCDHLKPIVISALNTGMRFSEIVNLTWENVSLNNGIITVEKTKSGKTRKIPINNLLTNVLSRLNKSGEFVFGNGDKPFVTVKTGFKKALKRAEIQGVTFHTLRHTFATNLVLGGVDLVTVKELLGHSNIEMTMRYSHPTSENKKRAVELLNSRNLIQYGHYMDTKALESKAVVALTT